MEYTVQLLDKDGFVVREAKYQQNLKEAKATLAIMRKETPNDDYAAFAINPSND